MARATMWILLNMDLISSLISKSSVSPCSVSVTQYPKSNTVLLWTELIQAIARLVSKVACAADFEQCQFIKKGLCPLLGLPNVIVLFLLESRFPYTDCY